MPRPMVAAVFSLLAIASACDPFHTDFEQLEPAQRYRAESLTEPPVTVPERLTVMTWNVKFGGGRIDFFFDCFGDRVLMERSEVLSNLSGLAEKIRQVSPDLLLLQEVDVNSKRSAFVDQVQWLLDHTELNYGLYASQWRADFVPSDGLGAMDSGNAILSRWPMTAGTRVALAERSDQDALTRYFYLRRNVLRAKLQLPGGPLLGIVAVHTDAYGQDGTKRSHIERFFEESTKLAEEVDILLAGGDLNTLPPGTTQQSDFPDSACTDEAFIADDYRAEADYLEPLYAAFTAAIPLSLYRLDNRRYYSHTVDGNGFWNRKLDYLFTDGTFLEGSGLVHQDLAQGGMETMPLSDHAPLSAELVLP